MPLQSIRLVLLVMDFNKNENSTMKLKQLSCKVIIGTVIYFFPFLGGGIVAVSLHAQGNTLQFGQVLLLNSTVASTNNLGTVPANKVWKIESFGGADNTVAIEGKLNAANAGRLTQAGNVGTSQIIWLNSWQMPVWLPAGTQLGYSGNNIGNLVWFSIIEFNLVP